MDRRRAVRLLFAALIATLCALAAPWRVVNASAGTGDNDPPRLTKSSPANGAVLNATPREIVFTFNKRLPAGTITVLLQNASNNDPMPVSQAIHRQNRSEVAVTVNNNLAVGRYRALYRVDVSSGSPLTGSITFTLEAPAGGTPQTSQAGTDSEPDDSSATDATGAPGDTSAGGSATSSPTPSSVPSATPAVPKVPTGQFRGLLGTVARLLGFAGLAAVFGALVLMAITWQEGVEYVNTLKHLRLMWLIGLAGNVLAVAALAADTQGKGITAGFSPSALGDVADQSLGKAVLVRLVATIGCAWIVNRPERSVEPGSQLMAFAVPAIGLATYGWSRTGVGVSAAAIPVGIVHALASACWFGGAALLMRVVLAGPGESDVVHALRGFRRVGIPAMFVTIISGGVQVGMFLGGLGNIVSTTYGKIFFLKIVAAILMAVVASGNRQYVRARLARVDYLGARPAARLHRSVRTEVMAGALALLLAGWLTGTTSPKIGNQATTTKEDLYQSADGLFVAELKFEPKQVGVNVAFHFTLVAPATLADALVTLRPVDNKSNGFEIPIPLPAGSTRCGFEATQPGFQFGTSGDWDMTVSAAGLQPIRAIITINNADGTVPKSDAQVPTPTSSIPSGTGTDVTTSTTVPTST